MIENLNGIHETVKYKENSNVKLFINAEAEDYPIHWHTPMEIIMPLEGAVRKEYLPFPDENASLPGGKNGRIYRTHHNSAGGS